MLLRAAPARRLERTFLLPDVLVVAPCRHLAVEHPMLVRAWIRTHLLAACTIPVECDLSPRAAKQHPYGGRCAAPLQLPGLPRRHPAPCAGQCVRVRPRG